MADTSQRRIVILLAAAALLAGLWWIPIRTLENVGLGGSWAIVGMACGALPFLAALHVFGRDGSVTTLALSGAGAIGLAVVLYSAALTETTVLRALVFFYLAPLWSLLIEAIWLKRRMRFTNIAAALLILLGILLLQGGGSSFSNSLGRGDLLAIGSGFVFAVGAALAFSAPLRSGATFTLFVAFACVIFGAMVAFALGDDVTRPVTLEAGGRMIGWSLFASLIFFVPVMYVTSKASMLLPPSIVTMLLPLEIVSGFVSATIWTTEAVTWSQGIGTVLISVAVLGTGHGDSKHS